MGPAKKAACDWIANHGRGLAYQVEGEDILVAALTEAREEERSSHEQAREYVEEMHKEVLDIGRMQFDAGKDTGRREAFLEAARVQFGVRKPSEEERARMRPQDWMDLGIEATRDAIRQLAGEFAPEPRPARMVPSEIRALAGQPETADG